jgi:hypothetical protein
LSVCATEQTDILIKPFIGEIKMKHIIKKEELVDVKAELGVREDWHEPDEQDVTAEVHGNAFDNAGAWGLNTQAPYEAVEKFVVIKKNEQPVAEVNLATLFAWASSLPKKEEQILPDFWTEHVKSQVWEILGNESTEVDKHILYSNEKMVLIGFGDNFWTIYRTPDKLHMSGPENVWYVISELSLNDALLVIREAIVDKADRHLTTVDPLANTYRLLVRHGFPVDDASDIFTHAAEDAYASVNWYDICRELGYEPDDILREAVMDNLQDHTDDDLLGVAESYFDADANKMLSDAVDAEQRPDHLLELAETLNVDVPEEVQAVLKDNA